MTRTRAQRTPAALVLGAFSLQPLWSATTESLAPSSTSATRESAYREAPPIVMTEIPAPTSRASRERGVSTRIFREHAAMGMYAPLEIHARTESVLESCSIAQTTTRAQIHRVIRRMDASHHRTQPPVMMEMYVRWETPVRMVFAGQGRWKSRATMTTPAHRNTAVPM